MNPPSPQPTRRDLLASLLAGGGFVLAFSLGGPRLRAIVLPAGADPTVPPSNEFTPNAFLRIGGDDGITIVAKHDEMGQGVHTSLAQLLCEELGADVARVRVVPAPADPVYAHSAFGVQVTGGSTSTWSAFDQMRKAGAAAREMLVAAAAARWGIEPAQCVAAGGVVRQKDGTRALRFGELAADAAKLAVPAEPALKDPGAFTQIGKPTHRVDSRAKVDGSARFSLDVRLPGMLTALIARAPTFGGKARRVDADAARAVRGVRAVLDVPSGVAVVADSFWSAAKGRAALKIDWEPGPGAGLDSGALRRDYTRRAQQPGVPARKDGDPDAALATAATKLDAVYEVPFQAHAPMETLSCLVALRDGGGADIYTGSQMLGGDHPAAAALLGVAPDQVTIHNHYLGGGFGRRANPKSDFVTEAVQVAIAARAWKAPVKTVWTREDDLQGGWYRPYWLNALAAGLDAERRLIAWRHRIVGQSIVAGTTFEQALVRDGIDGTSVEGAADMPYSIPNLGVELHTTTLPVPVQWWRSVGHSNTAFAKECFLDECAAAMQRDPYELRRELLGDRHPRLLRVLETAATKAGWGTPMPPGSGRGIAVHESFRSLAAHVAEVHAAGGGRPRVTRLICAIDCGLRVNPDQIEAQLEGAAIFALSAALEGQITFQDGRVQQSNFHDYPILRIQDAPRIEVHQVPSDGGIGGIGEVGVPSVAPAVANAIFAATGQRLRRLPLFVS
jgi:isoquinoline 1-oxidoreductase beta subunit